MTTQTTAGGNNEKPVFLNSNKAKVVTVLLGTYVVIFIGNASLFIQKRGDITQLGTAITWGSVVAVNIYTFGHISGAHINPALTLSLAACRQFSWNLVPFYVMGEMVGSTLACLTLKWLFDNEDAEILLTLPVDPNPASNLKVAAFEFIFTFVYAIVSFGARSDPRAIKEFGGVIVGASIFLGGIIAGKITGASLNPARTIGGAIVNRNFSKVWIYVISEMMAGLAASIFYFYYLMPQKGKHNDTNTASFQPEQEIGAATARAHSFFNGHSSSRIAHNEENMEMV